jgi:DNA mismatch endonuclease (patch repair protein)
MQRQRRRDTAPELALRRCLHARGLRFRVQAKILPGSRQAADIVFPGPKVVVFVDGCFWHGCPDHMTWPKNNAEWWRSKILANKLRDEATEPLLTEAGWRVIRIWEHEEPEESADRIAEVVRGARS